MRRARRLDACSFLATSWKESWNHPLEKVRLHVRDDADHEQENDAPFRRETQQLRLPADQPYRGAGDGDDCGEIILPVTPPVLFHSSVSTSGTPI